MNAQDNRDAMPFVQGDERCDTDPSDRRALRQDEGVLQHAHLQDEGGGRAGAKTKTIKWQDWNPFQRATGEALRQLNRRQRRQPKYQPDAQEALL